MRLHEITEPEYYEKSKITNQDMMEVYNSVYFMASTERKYSFGAALVNTLKGNLDFYKNDRMKYFNQFIYPIWEKHNFPIPGKEPFAPFLHEIKLMWRNMEKPKNADFENYEVIKSLLGVKD
jgi:hypothetical protein